MLAFYRRFSRSSQSSIQAAVLGSLGNCNCSDSSMKLHFNTRGGLLVAGRLKPGNVRLATKDISGRKDNRDATCFPI
jgi:hypothetical protein